MFLSSASLKSGAVGVCVGVVFGTAATYIGNNPRPFRYTAASIVALLSIRGLLSRSTTASSLSPLQHLKVLNYQPRSLSSSILSPNAPQFVHSRSI